jgi:very-short-patch-repair endonuclease
MNQTYHFYNKRLQPYAKDMRQNMTKAEACLWKYVIGGRKMMGYRFRRQRPILNFIADFCCMKLKLVIEVDGSSHDSEKAKKRDFMKDICLAEAGFNMLRFTNAEVLHDIENVRRNILRSFRENTPYPRKRGKWIERLHAMCLDEMSLERKAGNKMHFQCESKIIHII